jgi:hypothetical protein
MTLETLSDWCWYSFYASLLIALAINIRDSIMEIERYKKMKKNSDLQRPKRLITVYETYCLDNLDDWLSVVMANIEDALLTSGATPGVDYNILDLAKLAMPIVADDQKLKACTLTVSWP